jgi:hypothetical protein
MIYEDLPLRYAYNYIYDYLWLWMTKYNRQNILIGIYLDILILVYTVLLII